MTPVTRIGIYANLRKPKVWHEVPAFLQWMRNKPVEIVVDDTLRSIELLKDSNFAPISEMASTLDVVLSFGGDGTLLRCVKEVGATATPILGINLGGLGYLAELSIPELYRCVDLMIAGDFDIESRTLLQAVKNSGNSRTLLALNDFVFDRGDQSRTIRLRTSIDGEYLNTYTADGVIISTPTGSTGYSLSAGGPILEPTLDALILIPICPHTLAHRPMVIRSDRALTIETDPDHKANIMADGEYVDTVDYGEAVEIKRAPFTVNLINMSGRLFYHVLREKLHWGVDTRHPER